MKFNFNAFFKKNWPWLAGFAISQVALAALSKAQDKKREEEAMDEVRRITHESIQQMHARVIDTSGLETLREKIRKQHEDAGETETTEAGKEES